MRTIFRCWRVPPQAACALLTVIIAAGCALAQTAGPRIVIRTVDERTQFQIGEAIRLQIRFEAGGPGAYFAAPVPSLRRSRLQAPDTFSVTPSGGAVDPLADVYAVSDDPGVIAGVLPSPIPFDTAHPAVTTRDLNEFVVFRKPGRYTIRLATTRVAGRTLTSHPLTLRILPRDEAWAARQLVSARAALQAMRPDQLPPDPLNDHRRDSVRTLRYLETENAARVLAAFWGHNLAVDEEIRIALWASPHRALIRSELERLMAAPDLPLTNLYLGTAIEFAMREAEARSGGLSLTQAETDAIAQRTYEAALRVAPAKKGAARATTYYFLMTSGPRPFSGQPAIRQGLIAALPQAGVDVWWSVLDSEWPRFASPEIVPHLGRAISRTWPPGFDVAGMALRRLRELDPIRARQEIARLLAAGNFAVSDQQLLDVPVPSSPELDAALAEQYQQAKPVEARIARFASPALAGKIQERGTCVTPLTAYFFRVDAEAARRRLAEHRKANPPCNALVFNGFEAQLASPGLEKQALDDLAGTDPNFRFAAIQVLRAAGSEAAEQPLWKALEAAAKPGTDAANSSAQAIREALVGALLNGINWLVTPAKLDRLAALCQGGMSCAEVVRVKDAMRAPYSLTAIFAQGRTGFLLAHYNLRDQNELEVKAAQFPRGTVFRWRGYGTPEAPFVAQAHERARAVLAQHGLTLR
jgi:hypothetical protein